MTPNAIPYYRHDVARRDHRADNGCWRLRRTLSSYSRDSDLRYSGILPGPRRCPRTRPRRADAGSLILRRPDLPLRVRQSPVAVRSTSSGTRRLFEAMAFDNLCVGSAAADNEVEGLHVTRTGDFGSRQGVTR